MTTTENDRTSRSAIRHGDVGYLSLWSPDPAAAARFYEAVLGWTAAPGPEHHMVTGLSLPQGIAESATPTTFCCIAVDDLDQSITAVRAAGGTAAEPEPQPFGRVAACRDGQGWDFALYTPGGGTAAASPEAGHGVAGDTVYLTHETPDVERFKTFLHQVLGWEFVAGHVEGGWGPTAETRPMTGLHGGGTEIPRTVPMYRVADLAAATRAVQQHGGTASEPIPRPYGLRADCVDDQGAPFYLVQM